MQKRALPARHSFLTDAVRSTLERQSEPTEPHVDAHTIISVSTNHVINSYDLHPPPSPPTYPAPAIMPGFKQLKRPIAPRASSLKPSTCEPLSDEYYLKRHRKHELEEKKQKNREKERLQHELYQQQLLVEKIKSLDRSTLMSIISSIRQAGQADTATIDIELVHQQLLQGAEHQLHRYEMLGLGKNSAVRRKKTDSILPGPKATENEPKKAPGNNTSTANLQKKHAVESTSGKKRTSSRPVFGEKIPSMKRTHFTLPRQTYGKLMKERKDQWKTEEKNGQ